VKATVQFVPKWLFVRF